MSLELTNLGIRLQLLFLRAEGGRTFSAGFPVFVVAGPLVRVPAVVGEDPRGCSAADAPKGSVVAIYFRIHPAGLPLTVVLRPPPGVDAPVGSREELDNHHDICGDVNCGQSYVQQDKAQNTDVRNEGLHGITIF